MEHTLLINTADGRIYLDGKRIKTTKILKGYEKGYRKVRGEFGRKERFLFRNINHTILIGDVGWDGRIFFKLFKEVHYHKFRGKYFWIGSYFENHKTNKKEWYEGNMSHPIFRGNL